MAKAEILVERLKAAGKFLAAAESCTAGMAADMIARVPGASAVFWGSFVTYTLDAKMKMLGVSRECLQKHGAVSRETACAMAQGALEKSGADFAFSVTGLAGPDGDGSPNPVGLVWIGLARQGIEARAACFHFTGDRNEVRQRAAETAIEELLKYIESTLEKTQQ
ncbi:CinA family protein [Leadbettera azotonutricia]|uniref:Competence/damage-inducible protein CinA C-terminal domain protein n=1 Tax=Leadbettera azotonutricia (strain ATCC BAA-888 / DSM 13862 / ZAS-9) TaxID=545695 RepID=F5YFG3_LEAAZ|nr:nicotinamide-nucleotide amidohydrolase family protein [Leadbettera azotonutricia]AEF80572.1 competence/damage-inducible protein CinA C-terminal domain protein [Leadbettera azotonutricia ZAS-9]